MEFATGALGTLIPKLLQLLKDEYMLQKGARKNIEFLARELETIEAALRKVAEVPPEQLSELVRIWARDVRELSYDMEDIVDNFLVRIIGPDPPSKKSSKRFIKKMMNIATTAATRHEIGQEIKDIKERIKEVAERRDRYNLVGLRPAKKTLVDPRITAFYTEVTNLVGIDEAKEEVITMLAKGDNDKQPRIVSIAGFGGLGKTTLAKQVYDEINGQFSCTAFISVSRNPDTKKLLKDMLYELDKERLKDTNHSTKFDDAKHLMDLVREFLQNKRYLIVVDDIWDIKPWEIIRTALPENGFKNIIITTTRILDVAEKIGGCYKLKPLSHGSSKILFYGRIFGSEDKCPSPFSAICEKILKKCGGVPLAIITTSSLLANKSENINEWYRVCDSIGSGLGYNAGMDSMGKILLLSYYDLPSHLKTCLLYLSIFPEDYEIRRDRLIWRWIAEDFVQYGKEGQSLFELGESYFNELVNRSLIQPMQINDDGMPRSCRVHDMVFDLLCSLSREESFVVLDDKFSSGSKVRRLALHNRNEEHSLLVDDMGLKHLRSLNAIGCPMYMMPPVFSFLLLRVLDLENCGSMEGYDLEYLANLIRLRFIGLRNTFVRKLPQEIRRLQSLQTLELEGSGMEELPASMSELTGLMCLNADWRTRLSDWIGKLTSLQQLVMYPGYGDDENSAGWSVKELGNLGELRVLRCMLKARDEGELRDLLECLPNLKKIEVIYFDCYGVQFNNTSAFSEHTDFALSRTLRFLELRGLEFSRPPSWINPQDLPILCRLWLMVFDVDEEDLKTLGTFQGLCHLQLQIVNIKGGVTISSGFPSLKFCSITKPLNFVQGAMPRLEDIDFHFDWRVLTDVRHNYYFDFGLGNLTSLRQVVIRINCLGVYPDKVGKAEAAVRRAIHFHPNHPAHEICIFGQTMETLHPDLTVKFEKTDEPMDELIRILTMVNNDASSKKMKILSIARSEGLGNINLAQKVFDKLSTQFDCGAFVLVGSNADLSKVFTDILIGLDKQKYKDYPMTTLDLMDLIGFVRDFLVNKRFFVVVDDIWDLKVWEIIKCALIENGNGSAVLTTSGNIDITIVIGGGEQFLPLSAADPKKIFCKKLFGSEHNCPPELENICEKLIETCGGTLSVIDETVTSLASVTQTVKDWQAEYDRRKLALSYPDLSDNLKKCLLYFVMFQKGYEISGERLVWAWIAEGFVQETQGQTNLQEVGENYLHELVTRKMIEAVEVDAGGKALSCRAYDLVHDFIISKSVEANFAAILKDSQDRALPDTVNRLSIQGNTEVHNRPKAWLSQAKSLVVSCDAVAVHLKGINNSADLRYLVIGSKCIADIPKEITKLKLLRTLDLSTSGLNELPECVLSLRKLICLWVNSHMKIPDGIAKMSSLQELGDVNITKPELLKRLRKLSKLRVLRIAIWSWDDSFKSSVEQLCDNLRSLFIGFKKSIQSFSILTCCSLDFLNGLGDEWAPHCLQKLEIRRGTFDTLPSWFGSLPNISSLTIEVYKLSQDIIDMLGRLRTLCSLSLASKEVPEPEAYFVIVSDGFEKLKTLKFASSAMKEMFAPPQEATQQLKMLTIVFQASRTQHINKDFSFGLNNLCSLKHVRVEIICFNASHWTVNNAEAAIRKALSRDCTNQPILEFLRLEEGSMIEDVDFR